MKKKKLISYALIASMMFTGFGPIGKQPVEISANSIPVCDEVQSTPVAATYVPTKIPTVTPSMYTATPNCRTTIPVYTSVTKPTQSVPPTSPPPSEKVYHDPFFYMDTNVVFDESKDDQVCLRGRSVYNCVKYITYQGEELTAEDYNKSYDIVFSKEFCKALPYGESTVVAYVDYYLTGNVVPVEITINKVKSTVTATPTTVDNDIINVSVKSHGTNAISQEYVIKQTAGEDIDLKDLTIRYYFEDDNLQQFACDNAGITLERAPYYVDATKMVIAGFGKGYVEIKFAESYILKKDTVTLNVRLNHPDWSNYSEDVNKGKVEVYYKGKVKKLA